MLSRLSALLRPTAGSQVTLKHIAEQLKRIDAKVEAPRVKQYACLVDAENTQPSKLASVVSELNGYGDIVVRRIYGDFSNPRLIQWKAVSNELSFRPHAQFAIVAGKGSSDMAMAMDAISLLHNVGLEIDGFALVSSDSDFTPLASKLREEGKHVIGFGRCSTPIPFVNACHTFVHIENLGTQPVAAASVTIDQGIGTLEQAQLELAKQKAEMDALRTELAKATAQIASADEMSESADEVSETAAAMSKLSGKLKNLDVELDEAIELCLSNTKNKYSGDGWVDISQLATVLRRRNPSWDVRNFGMSNKQGFIGLLKLSEVGKLYQLKMFKKGVWMLRSRG